MADESGFEDFYLATRGRLLRQLCLVLGEIEAARDVTQDAYTRAWKHWDRVRGLEDPEGWVRRVAMNTAVSAWRRALVARRSLPLLPAQTEALPFASADYLDLVGALRQLPNDQRVALVLHEMADLSVEQVALETGVPVGTTKARLSRGRAALAKLLNEPVEEAL